MSASTPPLADCCLARAVRPLTAAHPEFSGVVVLNEGGDALAARVLLADAAELRIDAQYYIWRHDNAGTMLLAALRRAADRGVAVRLLLDDVNTAGLDDALAALDAHPCIEVRMFNPFRWRRWRLLGLLADFTRLNRRMHNKSFTVDAAVTIVGGRNIGDEYFGTGDGMQFTDLDVLAIGPVVADVVRDFERYWTSAPAQPLARVLGGIKGLRELTRASSRLLPSVADRYAGTLVRERCVRELLGGLLAFDWAHTRLVSDEPAKVLGHARKRGLLWSKLREIVGTPRHDLQLVTPYFVPTAAGVAFLENLAAQNVRISILTNSLEATDVAAVHAGYARWRQPLLRAGIALFESRRTVPLPRKRRRRGGSATSSLHTKIFAIDGERVFVGSFNFDPRSARLNTEMGLVIESPALASTCAALFTDAAAMHAYTVQLGTHGQLQWHQRDSTVDTVHDTEPGTSWWRRTWVKLLSWFPVEGLL